MLREEAPAEPEDPLPRCAVAVDTSRTVAIINRVLDLPEKDIMAASIQKPKDF
jgi:phosphosulfolactate phosphohydrolase-like enzyme